MSKALLCCGPLPVPINGFEQVWSLATLTERWLLSQGVCSQNLCDVPLPDLDQSLRERVETGLQTESARGGAFAWADIAYQHVHWRFLRYYQYRLRLERLIEHHQVSHLTVSSQQDGDVTRACVAACEKSGVQLEFQSGPCDLPSSLLSFLAAYDLPGSVSSLETFAARLLALNYRRTATRLFYQPYNNLAQGYTDAAVLTWRRSICFPGMSLPETELGRPRSFVNLDTPIRPDNQDGFDPQAWPGFDHHDLHVLSSAFSYFRQRYGARQIDHLYICCRGFFKQSRVRRLVLNSDNTCATRLLAKAARAAGTQIDYLPHGLIWEDLSLQTKTACGVDRVLAWNAASAAVFERHGSQAEVIVHASNAGTVTPKRPLPTDLSNLRVLIMPPEWVGLSFAGRPDCFERDLLDVLQALSQLGIKTAHVKCHNSVSAVLSAKLATLQSIRPYSLIDFTVLDSQISAQRLYDEFDLVIIGPTTGLLEASRSATPFIGFRAMMHKAGLFSDCSFPAANSIDELVRQIEMYDSDQVGQECIRMGHSLIQGVEPFSTTLDRSN